MGGCDLGKAVAKLVVCRLDEGRLTVERAEAIVHDGDPLGVFAAWYRREHIGACAALGATGLFATELGEPVTAGLPEDACLAAALAEATGPLNLISIGARGYAVMTRDAGGRIRWVENDKCSSGTGENMVRLAARFGMTLEEADRAAMGAQAPIAITARCSVFAKSELTHFANQGRPADQLLRGYFESVARYVAAMLERARIDGPIHLVGGGSGIRTIARALGETLGAPIVVPEHARFLEAIGAARLAHPMRLPEDPAELVRPRKTELRVLEPASRFADRVRCLPASPAGGAGPVVLGLDLGSTGSKAALTSIATGELVRDVYDRTRGNPVEAAARLIAELRGADVRAIAITGSGREAVAQVARAAWPGAHERIVVENEIVAHATAAIHCDQDGGESLSIVEIGGQDAKFIQIAGGQIVESDLNKACSAGTGSFLEEQAAFYGVTDIGEFTRLAQTATRPPDLGQMCTVFVADAAAEAHRQGFSIPDLFGGFQYSVVHNYIHRVMGQRSFGRRIFFQGKPASGPSLAWTLAAVTGREVVVPPNPGAMGAWGIGLVARAELAGRLEQPAFDLDAYLGANVVARAEFQCHDKRCATLCRIERTTVAVGDERRVVFSGGSCPKFEIGSRPKLPMDAPSAFDERAALLAPFLAGEGDVGVPYAGTIVGVLPWIVTLLRELGLSPRVLHSDGHSLARGEERCWSYDACAPVKIAHAVADAGVERLFLPKIVELADGAGPGGRTCPMEQALPEMVLQALRERGRNPTIVYPRLHLQAGLDAWALLAPLAAAARELGVDPGRVPAALGAAAAAQREYEARLADIGERTLRWALRERKPVVAVCGSLHVIHDPAVNAGIPGLLRDNGVLALPMDCYPLDAGTHRLPRIAWADANRALRVALASRRRGGVFPLWLSSFGCGPASFVEQAFGWLMEGYPHTVLESDGHAGAAGFVTRIQAFLHAVRRHGAKPSRVERRRLQLFEPLVQRPLDKEHGKVILFSVGDRLAPALAAVHRSFGVDAVAAPPASDETFALGRRDCTGKECVPYQLMWGSFRKQLADSPPVGRTVLMQVTGDGSCRNCMFSIKDQITLDKSGLRPRVRVRHSDTDDLLHSITLWNAAVAWGILHQLVTYHRTHAPEQAEALYRELCGELETLLERTSHGAASEALRLRAVEKLLERAAGAFAVLDLRRKKNGHRTVLLTGDIYMRLDDYASGGLARRLSAHGLRVIVEPVSVIAEYLALEASPDLLGLPTGFFQNGLFRTAMTALRRRLYGAVRPRHPWLPMPEVASMVAAGRPLLDRFPRGEAPVTVGSVLHAWHQRSCDGIVIAAPWGCAPALVSEALLRHQHEIPMLFLYHDGSPLDQRRLSSFVFRLRAAPART